MTPVVEPSGRPRRWPGIVVLGAFGLFTGALTLGLAPPAEPVAAVGAVLVLAAVGALAGVMRVGLHGLVILYVGLLVGLGATTWLRISFSEAGWGGFRSIQPVDEWRLAYAAFVAAGLFAVAVGYVLAGLRRPAANRVPSRPPVFLGGALLGSLVAGGALAAFISTTALVIPGSAPILRVTVTDGIITLEPAAVPAGEVHFIRSQRGRRYDGPFLESSTGPQGVAGAIFRGPLTLEDVAALRRGDLPGGGTVAELYEGVPAGEPAAWPTPDEYGGHERLAPGRYAWWTLEVGAEGPRMKDLAFFDAY